MSRWVARGKRFKGRRVSEQPPTPPGRPRNPLLLFHNRWGRELRGPCEERPAATEDTESTEEMQILPHLPINPSTHLRARATGHGPRATQLCVQTPPPDRIMKMATGRARRHRADGRRL